MTVESTHLQPDVNDSDTKRQPSLQWQVIAFGAFPLALNLVFGALSDSQLEVTSEIGFLIGCIAFAFSGLVIERTSNRAVKGLFTILYCYLILLAVIGFFRQSFALFTSDDVLVTPTAVRVIGDEDDVSHVEIEVPIATFLADNPSQSRRIVRLIQQPSSGRWNIHTGYLSFSHGTEVPSVGKPLKLESRKTYPASILDCFLPFGEERALVVVTPNS